MWHKLTPQLHVPYGKHVQPVSPLLRFHFPAVKRKYRLIGIYLHAYPLLVDVRIHLYIRDGWPHAQFHVPQYTVPHDLRIIGIAVGKVVNRDIMQLAIVDGQCQRMATLRQSVFYIK